MIDNRKETLAAIISPFNDDWKPRRASRRIIYNGTVVTPSSGLMESGYDLTLRDSVILAAGYMTRAVVAEYMRVPNHLLGVCGNKSTNHRMGITVAGEAEPGWEGLLTLELTYVPELGGPSTLSLPARWPICSVRFHVLMVEGQYVGNYQGATEAQGPR